MADSKGVQLYTHPDYEKNKPLWVTYRDTSEGDPRVMNSAAYVIKHDLERKKQGAGLYKARLERTAYTNFVEPIVGIWKNIMMSKDVNLDVLKKDIPDEELDDIDGHGTHFSTFISELTEMLLTYGWAYIVVDAPGSTTNTRPYMELVDPIGVVNWQTEYMDPERLGRFNFITRQYCAVRAANHEAEPSVAHFRETWVRDKDKKVFKQIYKAKSESSKTWELDGAPIPYPFLEEIPVAAIQYNESWIKDLTPNVIKYHNLLSGYENILHFQAYRQTWIVSNLPNSDRKAVAEYVLNFLPEGSTVQVINSENPIALAEHIKATELNIYKIGLNILRQVSNDSSAVQSVETIREERKNVLDLIKAEISGIEELINKALASYMKFKSGELIEGIALDRNVDLSAMDVLLPMYERLKDEIVRFPTWRKETLKRLAMEMQPGKLDQIKEEIDGDPSPQKIPNPLSSPSIKPSV